jgi:hypothetical protein
MAHTGLAFCAALLTSLSPCGIAVRQSILSVKNWHIGQMLLNISMQIDRLPKGFMG